jgi:hypothetical protein
LTTAHIDQIGSAATVRNRTKLIIAASVTIIAVTVAFLIANKPPRGDWVGISLHSLSTDDAQLVEESGAGWIRIDSFEGVEPSLAIAKTHNLKVLAILGSWMFDMSTNFSIEERNPNVTYYVAQYADYVDAWEIWNEPANPSYPLLGLNISSEENMNLIVKFYYSMVQNASQIIRQYDPTSKIVLFGGLNLYSGGDPNLGLDKNFATRLAAMNIEQFGDAFSVHAYPWTNDTSSWNFHTYDAALAYYRELFPSLEVWVTETGHYIDVEGEEGQARYMRGALEYFKGSVTRFFWYSLLDNEWEVNDPVQPKHFGLIADGKRRLAYNELRNKLK